MCPPSLPPPGRGRAHGSQGGGGPGGPGGAAWHGWTSREGWQQRHAGETATLIILTVKRIYSLFQWRTGSTAQGYQNQSNFYYCKNTQE